MKQFSGGYYRKFIKKCLPAIRRINEIEISYQKLSAEELAAKTTEFKARIQKALAEGRSQEEALDEILPEAFAAVKNASRRLCGSVVDVCGHPVKWEMVPYDEQLIGGMALHKRHITEMATGEGKTLVATLPLYLNALTCKNAQLVTVNDYLARRDAEWMGYIYKQLGLTVGCLQNQMDSAQRQHEYGCDITYGTASEFGFDYLRDNGMAVRKVDQVQRNHFFAIVDEVDSILIDEARTPLIISGVTEDDQQLPFPAHKPSVDRLVRKQEALCNTLAGEAREALLKNPADELAMPKLLKVKQGAPKNKQFLKLMEESPIRKAFEKYDLEMAADYNKKASFALKEELYYVIDERSHVADLTEKGRNEISPSNDTAFILPDLATEFQAIDATDLPAEQKEAQKREVQALFERNSETIHCISQLLRAYALYEKDVEYIVQDGKVMIVDENTGRVMPGRRWSDGLHAAVEAKEGVTIERETKTFATITLQNYFRMYEKLAGMTGTAETEVTEFKDIYNLSVMVVPTHKPCVRADEHDFMFKTRREKYNAVIAEIEEAYKKGQPVLVGTASVEASELLSRMLRRSNIAHNVLNAKFHEMEAEIVSRAGLKSAVTIATNMAGRGTDIKLGEGVADLGGLYVIGTERHQSRRIDRQLRGRSGRQGDPGRSRFYVSLEDDLMRLFGNAGSVIKMLESTFEEGQPIQHPLLTKTLETAQRRFEESNYIIRKRLLQFDDVLNRQRQVIYQMRNEALAAEDPTDLIFELVEEEIANRIANAGIFDSAKGFDANCYETFVASLRTLMPLAFAIDDAAKTSEEALRKALMASVREAFARVRKDAPEEIVREYEHYIILRGIDRHWQNHLTDMNDLRDSVGLRSYGQRDPLNEYKTEAYTYFQSLMGDFRSELAQGLLKIISEIPAIGKLAAQRTRVQLRGPESESQTLGSSSVDRSESEPKVTFKRATPKVGRNDPCPCGSGKKYKNCCGKE